MEQNKLDLIAIVIAIIGAINAGYLSWFKLTHTVTKCIPGLGDCATVNASKYSEVYGIPIAYLGFLAFLFLALLMYLGYTARLNKSLVDFSVFGITLIGTIFSGYLMYVEAAILKTYCPFCVLSAILMAILFGISIYKVSKIINS